MVSLRTRQGISVCSKNDGTSTLARTKHADIHLKLLLNVVRQDQACELFDVRFALGNQLVCRLHAKLLLRQNPGIVWKRNENKQTTKKALGARKSKNW